MCLISNGVLYPNGQQKHKKPFNGETRLRYISHIVLLLLRSTTRSFAYVDGALDLNFEELISCPLK